MCIHCRLAGRTFDARPESPKAAFARARRAETHYARQLRKVAKVVGQIVNGFQLDSPGVETKIEAALKGYADIIDSWAASVAQRMIAEVKARDEKAWFEIAADMSRELRDEIRNAPTGVVMRKQLADQIHLIKSLPLEAAERVHKLALEARTSGQRASTVATEIMRTGEVTQARANMIARTEVGRTAGVLTQARAEHIGSTGYIWRTAQDSDVRPSHKKMEGTFVPWGEPPVLDGLKGHAGALPNCRCYTEPVIPDA